MTPHRGCQPGQEHLGRPTPPMREKLHSHLVLLLGRSVDSRLDHESESVCITQAQKSTSHHRPYKESVA